MDKAKDLLCPFYEKTGVCGKGDMCNKTHRRPEICRCLLFHKIYPDPDLFLSMLSNEVINISETEKQNLLDSFFLDIVLMMRQFGELEDVLICGNKNDQLSGNLYAMFREAGSAESAYMALNNQYYAGRKIEITFSPIFKLSCAICKGFMEGSCPMGNACCFIHPLSPSEYITKRCFSRAARSYPEMFRKSHKTRIIDTPSDVLYGRAKSRYDERLREKK